MNKQLLNEEYFKWLCSLVCDNIQNDELLEELHNTEFIYTIAMDANRASDGVDLRYRFADEHNHHQAMIASYLDDRPCSMLEMMVALALRCEEDIMVNPDIGNRTGEWFWDMIDSLGLYPKANKKINKTKVHEVIEKFLNHEYEYDGKGGLFTIKNPPKDLRNVEIWYQLNWYLNELLER